ncbi:MAG: hypothetical protein ACOYJL_08095 [Tractidigestivibacter sp.]|jgi:ElaB/YqjD/DUF883 family membrane-anchored ribosome-binding protein|uniref:hypothetical protein n=1 Tax=Tractidigestivibacter sp. TaxID=2847320 RepID=UPI003D8E83DC
MFDINSNPATIRNCAKTVRNTINEIEDTSSLIERTIKSSADWSDEKGDEYREIMHRIDDLVKQPLDTLTYSAPQLDRLADALDDYLNTRF